MIWTILFYYLIIFITLYLWWLIFFRSYHNSDNNTWKGTWKNSAMATHSLISDMFCTRFKHIAAYGANWFHANVEYR